MLKSLRMPVVHSVIYDIVHYKEPLCMMKSQLLYKAFLLKAVMTFPKVNRKIVSPPK